MNDNIKNYYVTLVEIYELEKKLHNLTSIKALRPIIKKDDEDFDNILTLMKAIKEGFNILDEISYLTKEVNLYNEQYEKNKNTLSDISVKLLLRNKEKYEEVLKSLQDRLKSIEELLYSNGLEVSKKSLDELQLKREKIVNRRVNSYMEGTEQLINEINSKLDESYAKEEELKSLIGTETSNKIVLLLQNRQPLETLNLEMDASELKKNIVDNYAFINETGIERLLKEQPYFDNTYKFVIQNMGKLDVITDENTLKNLLNSSSTLRKQLEELVKEKVKEPVEESVKEPVKETLSVAAATSAEIVTPSGPSIFSRPLKTEVVENIEGYGSVVKATYDNGIQNLEIVKMEQEDIEKLINNIAKSKVEGKRYRPLSISYKESELRELLFSTLDSIYRFYSEKNLICALGDKVSSERLKMMNEYLSLEESNLKENINYLRSINAILWGKRKHYSLMFSGKTPKMLLSNSEYINDDLQFDIYRSKKELLLNKIIPESEEYKDITSDDALSIVFGKETLKEFRNAYGENAIFGR